MLVHSNATTRDVNFQYFKNRLEGYLSDFEVSGEIFYLEQLEAEVRGYINFLKEQEKNENNNKH